jgi:hypothetical protein
MAGVIHDEQRTVAVDPQERREREAVEDRGERSAGADPNHPAVVAVRDVEPGVRDGDADGLVEPPAATV